MSRIGKKNIKIPSGVTVSIQDGSVVVEGPLGSLTRCVSSSIIVACENDEVMFSPREEDSSLSKFWGLERALVNNMIIGVHQGFKKHLVIEGVGYKFTLKGKVLVLDIGKSHPVEYSPLEGVKLEVPDVNTCFISGVDKQKVGQCAADIRKFLPVEPYKGKGIRYVDEKVRRKAGKSAK